MKYVAYVQKVQELRVEFEAKDDHAAIVALSNLTDSFHDKLESRVTAREPFKYVWLTGPKVAT